MLTPSERRRRGRHSLPTYAELLERQDAPPGSSWGVFGPDDHLGTLNLLGEDQARAAASTGAPRDGVQPGL